MGMSSAPGRARDAAEGECRTLVSGKRIGEARVGQELLIRERPEERFQRDLLRFGKVHALGPAVIHQRRGLPSTLFMP